MQRDMPLPSLISAVIIADEIVPDAVSAGDPGKKDRYKDVPRLLETLAPRHDEVIIVAADPLDFLANDALIVRLHQDKQGPLGAVYTGLFAARHQQALAVHCRMPMVEASTIARLIQAAESRFDAVVAAPDGPGLFPAVYHKRCLKILAQLWAGDSTPPSAERFFKQVRVHTM
jgi:molybdopterin-guanine dinucleotide biosynthesis protein A